MDCLHDDDLANDPLISALQARVAGIETEQRAQRLAIHSEAISSATLMSPLTRLGGLCSRFGGLSLLFVAFSDLVFPLLLLPGVLQTFLY